MQTQTQTKTKSITGTLVRVQLGAFAMAAAFGIMMGSMYYENGGQLFPEESFDRYEEVLGFETVEVPSRLSLDGEELVPQDQGVYAVPVDNFIGARGNQSGLSQASIIYESLTEGEITRFFALYDTSDIIVRIGPVRSMRLLFPEWLIKLNGLMLHAGSDPYSLVRTTELNIKTADQLGGGHGYFYRNAEQQAPHNLYTSSELAAYGLRDLEQEGEYAHESPEYSDVEINENPEIASMRVDISTEEYVAEYEYNFETGTYDRFTAGAPHVDSLNQEQLSPANVVMISVPSEVIDEEGRRSFELYGEGEAILFNNGQMQRGFWLRDNPEEQLRYVGEDGSEMLFVPGQIMIHVVNDLEQVAY